MPNQEQSQRGALEKQSFSAIPAVNPLGERPARSPARSAGTKPLSHMLTGVVGVTLSARGRRYLDCVRRRGAFGTAKPASDTRRHARVLCAQNIKLLVLPRWRSRRLVLSELSAASAVAYAAAVPSFASSRARTEIKGTYVF